MAKPSTPWHRRSILVVDDMREVSDTLGLLLSGLGFHVRTACSGEAALQLIEDEMPDAVISDIEMPGMGGLDLARTIRRNEVGHALLIAVSGSSQSLLRAAGLFDHTLPKPVSIGDLEELLVFEP